MWKQHYINQPWQKHCGHKADWNYKQNCSLQWYRLLLELGNMQHMDCTQSTYKDLQHADDACSIQLQEFQQRCTFRASFMGHDYRTIYKTKSKQHVVHTHLKPNAKSVKHEYDVLQKKSTSKSASGSVCHGSKLGPTTKGQGYVGSRSPPLPGVVACAAELLQKYCHFDCKLCLKLQHMLFRLWYVCMWGSSHPGLWCMRDLLWASCPHNSYQGLVWLCYMCLMFETDWIISKLSPAVLAVHFCFE